MTRTPAARRRRELVLVGGGHTHVQVLRAFAMEPPPGVRTTVVLDRPVAVYSGMVPGFVAGQYRADELEIDVVPLARRAGARVVLARCLGVDPRERRVLVAGRPALRYDVASFDVGSTVAGLELPGVAAFALPTRPVARLVARVDELLAGGGLGAGAGTEASSEPFQVAVVGGGAGGVELAFALRHRLGAGGRAVAVTLLDSGEEILPRYPPALVRRVRRWAGRRGIEIVTGVRVAEVTRSGIALDSGATRHADLVVWVSGAVAHGILRASGLATDARGFALVGPTLQVPEHPEIFAVGDCATLHDHPQTPKAGVYAVRQGPYLVHNLRVALGGGGTLRRYRPQRDFLTLLNLGDGEIGQAHALGAKWGVSFEGRWALRLKDWIDRRFMTRFQVLADDGRPRAALADLGAMDREAAAMRCGGCAAKLGATALAAALRRLPAAREDPSVVLGLAAADDAAAIRTTGGDLVAVTVDAFRAFTDDPFLVGRVAAVNAVSDLHAKGARPRHALALVTLPEDDPAGEETLFQVLAGVRAALDALDVTLLGGHTTTGAELAVGLTVLGDAVGELLPLGGLRPGQALVLTKALGTGVLFHADMQGLARGPWIEAAIAAMTRSNADAARVAREHGATAMTDVSGFGLAVHLGEMLRASRVAAELDLAALPLLDGAPELLRRGLRSTFHPENAAAARELLARVDDPAVAVLLDPQTSGGLLFGVPTDRAVDAVAALHAAGDTAAAIVGHVVATDGGGALLRTTSGAPPAP